MWNAIKRFQMNEHNGKMETKEMICFSLSLFFDIVANKYEKKKVNGRIEIELKFDDLQ